MTAAFLVSFLTFGMYSEPQWLRTLVPEHIVDTSIRGYFLEKGDSLVERILVVVHTDFSSSPVPAI